MNWYLEVLKKYAVFNDGINRGREPISMSQGNDARPELLDQRQRSQIQSRPLTSNLYKGIKFMLAKNAPGHFPLAQHFKGVSADQVRESLRSTGFTRHDRTPMLEVYESRKLLGVSEIWFIECNTAEGSGFAAARLDLQGHAKKEAKWTVRMEENTAEPRKNKRIKEASSDPIAAGGVQQFYFEQVPHYHKEWVGSESLTKYLTEFVPDIEEIGDGS